FTSALRAGTIPVEVTTDRAPVYPRVLDELIPSALHTVEQYANNPIDTDHGRLKAQLRPMRGLKRQRSATASHPQSCFGVCADRHNATAQHPIRGLRRFRARASPADGTTALSYRTRRRRSSPHYRVGCP